MMLVKSGVGREDQESRGKLRVLVPGLKERFPDALDEEQWEILTKSL